MGARTMIGVELFDVSDGLRLREALAVRVRVFVEEQGFALVEESDDHDRVDRAAVHALARDGATPLGAGRFYEAEEAGTVQIGRLAVLREARGLGIGSLLLAALLGEAARRRYSRAVLLAQVQARDFYLKAGFLDDGCSLWDGSVLHQRMAKTIESGRRGLIQD
jgi:ElaA protein